MAATPEKFLLVLRRDKQLRYAALAACDFDEEKYEIAKQLCGSDELIVANRNAEAHELLEIESNKH